MLETKYRHIKVRVSGRKSLTVIAAACVMASVAAVLYMVDPAQAQWMPRCMLHSLTGWQCPSCGLMRATHSALHGHWHEALMYNPMLPVLLGLAGVIIVRLVVFPDTPLRGRPCAQSVADRTDTTGRGRPSPQSVDRRPGARSVTRRLVWLYLLLYCGWGVARNLLGV